MEEENMSNERETEFVRKFPQTSSPAVKTGRDQRHQINISEIIEDFPLGLLMDGFQFKLFFERIKDYKSTWNDLSAISYTPIDPQHCPLIHSIMSIFDFPPNVTKSTKCQSIFNISTTATTVVAAA